MDFEASGWKRAADGVKVQARTVGFWDDQRTEDYDEKGNVHTPTKESIKAYEENMPAFDMKEEVDFGTKRMSTADIQKIAQAKGWADPMAFSVDMLTDPAPVVGRTGDFDPSHLRTTTQFKQEFADARGINGTKRNKNQVQVKYKTDEDGNQVVDGYIVNAGAVEGTKNHTALLYEYDKYGRFKGANTDMEERGIEGAAPLINMAVMAATMGGGAAALGGSINSAANLGLTVGGMGEAALGGAALGAGSSALLKEDPLKGAVLGGMGSAVQAWNPAGTMGFAGNQAKAVNGLISTAGKSLVTGKAPSPISFGMSALQASGWK
jgi:hypothetical protein